MNWFWITTVSFLIEIHWGSMIFWFFNRMWFALVEALQKDNL